MNKQCDFCGANEEEGNLVLEGKTNICKSCAEVSLYLMNMENNDLLGKNNIKIKHTPSDYKNMLDKYIIGQDTAKKVLSVAVYNHLQRVNNPKVNINKSNVLFLGGTGTGKDFFSRNDSR